MNEFDVGDTVKQYGEKSMFVAEVSIEEYINTELSGNPIINIGVYCLTMRPYFKKGDFDKWEHFGVFEEALNSCRKVLIEKKIK